MPEATTLAAPIRLDEIADMVAGFYYVEVRNLKGPCRNRSFAYPRQIFMYLARRFTRRSYEEIGAFLGQRHHTTVLHGVRCVTECVTGIGRQLDPRAQEVAYLEKQLLGRAEKPEGAGMNLDMFPSDVLVDV